MRALVITICFVAIFTVPESAFSMDRVESNFHEKNIPINEAISLGFIPELVIDSALYGEDESGISEFRIARPDKFGECGIWFATIRLISNGKGVTEYQMTKYWTDNKGYFSSRINPQVINEVSISVWCKEQFDINHNHSHQNIIKFSVVLNAL